jgi:hypothetical protein
MSQFFTFGSGFGGDLNVFRPSLWLDADPATMTLAGADVVQWQDKSGNGRNFTQGTSGFRPDYEPTGTATGKPCVAFDGTDDFMPMDSGGLGLFNGASAMTVLIVGQMATVTSTFGVWFYASNGTSSALARFNIRRASGGANNLNTLQVRRLDAAISATLQHTGAEVPNQMSVILAQYDPVAQTLAIYADDPVTPEASSSGVLTTGPVSATSSLSIRLGTDGDGVVYKAMKIRTVGAWTRILGTTERVAIMNYYRSIN